MRKFLTIFFFIISIVGFAQNPSGPTPPLPNWNYVGSPTTLTEIKGVLRPTYAIILSRWADTATANANAYISSYAGALIIIGDTMWVRNSTATAWNKAGSGSGAGLVDADYGDITVSGTGTVMTIDNGVVTNAKLQFSSITVQGVPISLGSSGNIINGTGFVKASGTTITYDNSTYFTTASQGLTASAGDVQLFGPLATPALLSTERSINLGRKILHLHNSQNSTSSGGVQWGFSQPVYSPYQFISEDTVTTSNVDPPTAAVPWSGLYARRSIYYGATNGITTQKVFGHILELKYNWIDSFRLNTQGGDYNVGTVAQTMYEPRGIGSQRLGIFGTGSNNLPYYGVPTFMSNTVLRNSAGNTIHTYGWLTGISSYLVAGSNGADTIERFSFYQTNNFLASSSKARKLYGLDFQHSLSPSVVDSSFGVWDQYGYRHWFRGNVVFGTNNATNNWSSSDQVKIIGNLNVTDTVNIGAANAMSDSTGLDILLRRRINGGVERIRFDQLGVVVGGIYYTNGTISGDRAVALNGNSIDINQGSSPFLTLDPTAGAEVSQIQAYNTTGGDNFAQFKGLTANTAAQFEIAANFNGSSDLTSIVGNASSGSSTLTYLSDDHLMQGNTFEFQTGGVGLLGVSSTAQSGVLRAIDFTNNDNQARVDVAAAATTADLTTQTNFNAGVTSASIAHHSEATYSSLDLTTFDGTGNDNTTLLSLISDDVSATFQLSASFDGTAEVASISANTNTGNADITYAALEHFFDGSVEMHDLAGFGSGFIAVNNLGHLSFAATAVTDGDKGDIVVSGSGATWVVDDASVEMNDLNTTGTPNGAKFLRDDGQWTAIPGGGDALTSNPLSQFAATTSLQFKGVISDETGSGAVVFATSPALVTPDLGTPSAATLTNATGLPISTGVSGLGTGVATALATASSANWASAFTNETGSGLITFATAPSMSSITLAAGTSSAGTAPLYFTSGTSLSSVVSGAFEFDGTSFFSSTASGRGVSPSTMFATVQGSDFTLSDVNTDQNAFPSAVDVWTLQGSTTYYFDGMYDIASGATSHSIAIGFTLGGGASITSIRYTSLSWPVAINTATTTQTTTTIDQVASTAVNAAGANARQYVRFYGHIRMNAGGTVTPIIKFSAAPGGTIAMKQDSYIRFTPVGSNTVASVGNVN